MKINFIAPENINTDTGALSIQDGRYSVQVDDDTVVIDENNKIHLKEQPDKTKAMALLGVVSLDLADREQILADAKDKTAEEITTITKELICKLAISDADKNKAVGLDPKFIVKDPVSLSSDEIEQIKAKLEEVNPKATSIVVNDGGNVVLTYEDGSENMLLPSMVIAQSLSTKFILYKLEPLVGVKNTEQLTEKDIQKVRQEVIEQLKAKGLTLDASQVDVTDKAEVSITYPDGSSCNLTADKVVTKVTPDSDKYQAIGLDPLFEVFDIKRLSEDEIFAIKQQVREKNPRSDKVEMTSDNNVEVFYPDGSSNILSIDKVAVEHDDLTLYKLVHTRLLEQGEEAEFSDLDTSKQKNMSYLFSNWANSANPHFAMMEDTPHKWEKFSQAIKKFNGIVKFDTSKVTDMKYMFSGAESFNRPINFDTSNVITFELMFFGAKAFNKPVNFNTTKATRMSGMFNGASSFNQPLNFNTSKVTNMAYMFRDAEVFNQELNFDTSKVIRIGRMFYNAKAFNKPINFNLVKVEYMGGMFEDATSFDQDLAPLVKTVPVDNRPNIDVSALLANCPSIIQSKLFKEFDNYDLIGEEG